MVHFGALVSMRRPHAVIAATVTPHQVHGKVVATVEYQLWRCGHMLWGCGHMLWGHGHMLWGVVSPELHMQRTVVTPAC